MTRPIITTPYSERSIVTSDYTTRIYPGVNCMDIIITGFWDDIALWQDTKIWWDAGSAGTGYSTRTEITTPYT